MRRAAVALPLLVVLLLPLPGAGAAFTPVLSPGDHWECVGEDAVVTERVRFCETIQMGGVGHEGLYVVEERVPKPDPDPDAGPGSTMAATTRTTWLRASDLAFLRTEGPAAGGANGTLREEAVATLRRYALAPRGGRVVGRLVRDRHASGGGEPRRSNRTMHRRVLAPENVSVPVGTFTSWRIETRAEGPEGPVVRLEWCVREACGVVRTERIREGGVEVAELRSYRCLVAPYREPTPGTSFDTCTGLPMGACTPGPGAAMTLLALGLVGGALAVRRAKRS